MWVDFDLVENIVTSDVFNEADLDEYGSPIHGFKLYELVG